MPHEPVILTAKLIAVNDAEGERRERGQDDPGAAGVLDLDPGPEMGASPGSSSGPDPADGRARERRSGAGRHGPGRQGAGGYGCPDRPHSVPVSNRVMREVKENARGPAVRSDFQAFALIRCGPSITSFLPPAGGGEGRQAAVLLMTWPEADRT